MGILDRLPFLAATALPSVLAADTLAINSIIVADSRIPNLATAEETVIIALELSGNMDKQFTSIAGASDQYVRLKAGDGTQIATVACYDVTYKFPNPDGLSLLPYRLPVVFTGVNKNGSLGEGFTPYNFVAGASLQITVDEGCFSLKSAENDVLASTAAKQLTDVTVRDMLDKEYARPIFLTSFPAHGSDVRYSSKDRKFQISMSEPCKISDRGDNPKFR